MITKKDLNNLKFVISIKNRYFYTITYVQGMCEIKRSDNTYKSGILPPN